MNTEKFSDHQLNLNFALFSKLLFFLISQVFCQYMEDCEGVISSAKPADKGEFVVNHSVCFV